MLHKSYKTKNPDTEELQDNRLLVSQGEDFISKYLRKYLKENLPNYPQEGRNAIAQYLMSEKCLSHVAKHIGLKDIVLCAVSKKNTSYIF